MTRFDSKELLARIDMFFADDNMFKSLWWNLMPGKSIKVKWPRGWTEIDELGNQFESSDPNDHYRPWLEKNVGKQGWDWDWKVDEDNRDLLIRFRRGKQQEMMLFSMRWT